MHSLAVMTEITCRTPLGTKHGEHAPTTIDMNAKINEKLKDGRVIELLVVETVDSPLPAYMKKKMTPLCWAKHTPSIIRIVSTRNERRNRWSKSSVAATSPSSTATRIERLAAESNLYFKKG